MSTLSHADILSALERLGALAAEQRLLVRLVVVGGAAMVLGYQARLSTQDVDVLILPPPPAHEVRALAKLVAQKRAWPAEWLNDAAKGYLVGLSDGPTLIAAPGIEVRQPTAEQLLAMKLCAWRDDVDINDAARLLQELRQEGDAAAVWRRVSPYLLRGRELKAQYAFTDLWGSLDEPA